MVEELLRRCREAGEGAYQGADYDLALACFSYGRILKMNGTAETGLTLLAEARRRFEGLYNLTAATMAAKALSEYGDCLVVLGRLDEAAQNYERQIGRSIALDDQRGIAVGKGQLATLRMQQGRYGEAIAGLQETLALFEVLGEPGAVAIAWHQIGILRNEAGQYEAAEHAFRQSLAIKNRLGNSAGEAADFGELGNLYQVMGRLEEAVTFNRRATDIYVRLGDMIREGRQRGNAARSLILLGRHEEARRELLRAIECNQPFGHTAEPWKTLGILHHLERESGNIAAAEAVRYQAEEAYLSYRRTGGVSQSPVKDLFSMIAEAAKSGLTQESREMLADLSQNQNAPWFDLLLARLEDILDGERNPASIIDSALDYDDVVELQLLLETLSEADNIKPTEG